MKRTGGLHHGKRGHRGGQAAVGGWRAICSAVRGGGNERERGWGGNACDDVDDHGLDVCFGALAALLEKRIDDFALAGVGQGRVAGGADGLEQRLAHFGR